jgi:hypothetical protein
MKIFKCLVFTFLAVFFIQELKSQSLNKDIINATQKGNANDLSKFFNDKVELTLPSKSGVYSKEQAQFIIADFFSNNRPVSFQINHEGTRDNSSYAIGSYVSSKEKFRFYFLTKNIDNKTVIIQIRIDKQDE